VPVTKEVVNAALDLRRQTGQRIPNADAIIAATAKLEGGTLVHRAPHLSAIPLKLVKQLVLQPKTKAPPRQNG